MIDLKKIKAFYNFSRELSLSDIQVLLKTAKQETYEPNDFLIKEGFLKKRLYHIQSGLVRSFILNEKGEEITTSLIREHQIMGSPDIILHNQASRYYYQALEKTIVRSIDYDVLQEIISKHPKLEKNRKFVFQKIVKEAYERIESFVLYSPEERYIRYIEANPDMNNRVPNKYLANVLGITPVSLSRIRKRIASRRKLDE